MPTAKNKPHLIQVLNQLNFKSATNQQSRNQLEETKTEGRSFIKHELNKLTVRNSSKRNSNDSGGATFQESSMQNEDLQMLSDFELAVHKFNSKSKL